MEEYREGGSVTTLCVEHHRNYYLVHCNGDLVDTLTQEPALVSRRTWHVAQGLILQLPNDA